MKFAKIAVVISALFATFLSGSVQAAPMVYSTAGTITSGTDDGGVFGLFGSLVGATYSMSLTMDTSMLSKAKDTPEEQSHYGTLNGFATAIVTVAGVTKTYLYDLTTPVLFGDAAYSAYGTSQIFSYIAGTANNGEYMDLQQYITSWSSPVLESVALTSPMYYETIAGDAGTSYFSAYGMDSRTTFWGAPTFYSIQAVGPAVDNDVPEPAPLAMLALGLVALGAARRKTRA